MAEYDVFLSYSWWDAAEVDRLEAALVGRGLRVFRDKRMPAFEAITGELAHAVDSSAVFLAYYSAHYPTRYACQWELTRAFLAARRMGDPRARVLVVNPEADENHIAPIELTDAAFPMWRATGSAAEVADRIAAKVAAAGSRPLGPPAVADLSGLDLRLTKPRWFVGRYRDMWDIHSALHGGRLRAVTQPRSDSTVVVKALAGMGKTALAEQYGFLFAEAYPGGVMWTELGAGARTVSGDEAIAEFAAQLREQAKLRFGVDLTGLDPDRTRTVLASRVDERNHDVLCVVDDLPAGMTRAELDRLIIPSELVHTVLTARTVSPDWPVASVELEGLTTVEVEALFRAYWPELDPADRAALAKLTARSGGHPLVLAAAARALRAAQGTAATDRFAERLDGVAGSVVDELAGVIRGRGPAARLVLGLAATLGEAPFGADLVVAALARHLGRDVDQVVAAALAELDEFNLVSGVRRSRCRQMWQVHALVASAARADVGAVLTDELARDVARVLTERLPADAAPSETHRHARVIATNPAVPLAERRALLRAVTTAHEHHGDIPAARDAAAEAVRIAGPDRDPDDVLAAARLAIAAGDPAAALDHTEHAIRRAHAVADWHTEYRARFLAAASHDMRGRYAEADAVFHAHPRVAAEGEAPNWMPHEESLLLRIERIAARRVRGHYRAAYEEILVLRPQVPREHPDGTHRGLWPAATLELAHLQLRVNRVRDARRSAGEVRKVFEEAGLRHHPFCRAATGIYAESELVTVPTEITTPSRRWRQAAARIGVLRVEAESFYGPDNPHALNLTVTYARALVGSEDPSGALRVLAEAEPRIAAVLGAEHPLRLRARFVAARSRTFLGEYGHAREVLEDLLPRQVAVLGRDHPDALVTRGDLGVALAAMGETRAARQLMVEARRGLLEQFPWWHEDSFKALVGVPLTVLPTWAWRAVGALTRRTARPPE